MQYGRNATQCNAMQLMEWERSECTTADAMHNGGLVELASLGLRARCRALAPRARVGPSQSRGGATSRPSAWRGTGCRGGPSSFSPLLPWMPSAAAPRDGDLLKSLIGRSFSTVP
eukprot:8838386-Pyramimonas_sp.AAC.1